MLRGVAALLVVVVHAINVSDWRVAQGLDSEAAWLATAFSFNEFGASGVDLFFVISGFVMAMMLTNRPDQPIADFALDRLIRIVPLFWLASAVFAIALLSLGRPIPDGSVLAALTILPLPFADYSAPVLVVGWSLGFELIFYAFVALSLLITPRWRVATIAGALALALSLGGVLSPGPGFAAYLFNSIFAEFLLGIGCFVVWYGMQTRPKPMVARLLAATGLVLIAQTAIIGYPFATPHLPIVAGETGMARTLYWGVPWAMTIAGLLLDTSRNRGASQSIVHRIGDASYSLYLVHMVICVAAESLTPPNMSHPGMMIIMTIAGSVILGLWTHRYVEAPMLRALRSVGRGRQLPLTAATAAPVHD